jgi:hypothetical protein
VRAVPLGDRLLPHRGGAARDGEADRPVIGPRVGLRGRGLHLLGRAAGQRQREADHQPAKPRTPTSTHDHLLPVHRSASLCPTTGISPNKGRARRPSRRGSPDPIEASRATSRHQP